MAGPSIITLFRSEDSTIDIKIQQRRAARIAPANLSGTTVRLKMRAYPLTSAAVLYISDGAIVHGCHFDVIALGVARLTIPVDFWALTPASRFSIEVWIETPTATQRVGLALIDVTG